VRYVAQPADAYWHGTANGYNNYRCRCRPCTDAWAEYHRTGAGNEAQRRYRAKLLAAGKTTDSSLTGRTRQVPFRPRKNSAP